MDKGKIDQILKVILTVFLFLVPSVTAIVIWSIPVLGKYPTLIAIATTNLFLSLAEVMFLVRAVIFPKNNKKWWRDE